MNTINIAVTKKTVAYLADKPDNNQRQIAIQDASPGLRKALNHANKNTPVTIRLAGRITLIVGDTHAIWRSHNIDNVDEYDRLFDLLALRPDEPMFFHCGIVS